MKPKLGIKLNDKYFQLSPSNNPSPDSLVRAIWVRDYWLREVIDANFADMLTLYQTKDLFQILDFILKAASVL